MQKNLIKSLSIMSIATLVIQATSVNAFIGEDAGIDFFKTLDKGSVSTQQKFIENELVGSAKKIDEYLSMKLSTFADFKQIGILDTSKDFKKSELDAIRDDGNVAHIFYHLKEEYQSGTDFVNAFTIGEMRFYISEWYTSKEGEMMKKEASMSKIAVSGLYNDGSKENSGYDIIDDLKKINSVIFSSDIDYAGTENQTSLEFGDILGGMQNGISSVFTDTSAPLNNYIPVAGGVSGSSAGNASSGQGQAGNAGDKLDDIRSQSNICNTGSDLSIMGDLGLLADIQSQLQDGENSTTVLGGRGNSNGETSGSGNARNARGGSGSQSGGNGSSGAGGGLFDSFPCDTIFCIEISMTMYKQNLLGGKTSSIEGIVDKHLKIIDLYAGKSMIQSDMTKNFFSLSILRNLNLPSMAYLGIVVSHLPPPILNLKKKSGTESNELADKSILERTFSQNGLDYKTQNAFNPDYEYKKISECVGLDMSDCLSKSIDQQSVFTPYISNSDIMINNIGQNYKESINDDIAELVGFSNTFKTNIDQITDTIVAMSKNKN